MLQQFSDIHTHLVGKSDSVLSIPFHEVEGIDQPYSLQLHPWHLTGNEQITAFEQCARLRLSDPNFIALGECGLDPLCSTPMDLQHAAFLSALRLAKELHKPLIIHCVKLWSELINDVSQVLSLEERVSLPVIIHGYRKGPQLARQLLDAGFSLSLGKHYHKEVRDLIPPDRLYFETDEDNPNKPSLPT